ncbi:MULTISPECIES: AraC family transcriptional regulator [unclassified Mesorhizobium]|uniref:helix-turn-helix domain-containing protein n=1 Tax=unclassified Mesorhizobium TaxID=325217 RepID=UPI001FEDE047|nr:MULTISPECIES: AraC family transcriptional regulator [unclassified Mesorhizobium]
MTDALPAYARADESGSEDPSRLFAIDRNAAELPSTVSSSFLSRIKNFLCAWKFFSIRGVCVTLIPGQGKGIPSGGKPAEATRMKHAGGARESGDSQGVDQERTARYVLDIIPESAGPRRATARGSVIYSVRSPGSQKFLAREHSTGIVLRPARKLRASLGSDRITQYDAPVGCLVVNPAGVDSTLAWSQTRENAVVSISPEALSELAAHEFDLPDVKLEPPAFGTVDLRALNIAQMITAELTDRLPPNELYLDSLLTVFGVHLLRGYTGRKRQAASPKGGLSAVGARRVREYLDQNFVRKVMVAELASGAGVSPNHFIARFAGTFGMPPHRYLINLRLDLAEKLLAGGELPIAEVAYLAGFSDQSHLAATMKRYRGRTPGGLVTLSAGIESPTMAK